MRATQLIRLVSAVVVTATVGFLLSPATGTAVGAAPPQLPAASRDGQAPVPVRSSVIPLAGAAVERSTGVRTVRTAAPFSMAGVRWTGPAPDRIELRNRTSAGGWSGWMALERSDGRPAPDGSLPRTAEPVWTGPTTQVQVRAYRDGRPATDGVELVTIDPGATAEDARLSGAAAQAAPAKPPVVSRAGWGADESLMTWAPEYPWTTKAVTMHHTAGSNDYTCAQSASIIRGIYHYHAVTNGWGDIGYNALIDKCGTIFEGRKGGLDLPTIGAHAGGFNTYTFGISMLGDFTTISPSATQLEAVSVLAAWKLGNSYRNPLGSTVLVSTGSGTSKYPAGTAVTLPVIFGHRDVGNTTCPGNTGYAKLGQIRTRVAQLVGDWTASPIYQKWQQLGGESGWAAGVHQLEQPTAGGGRAAYFAGGVTITTHPTHGTHYARFQIRSKWVALGGAGWGYPVTDEQTASGGATFNRFSNGASVYFSAATGAHAISGPILGFWTNAGGAASQFGLPVSDEFAFDGKRRQDFLRVTVLYDPSTGRFTTVPRRPPLGAAAPA